VSPEAALVAARQLASPGPQFFVRSAEIAGLLASYDQRPMLFDALRRLSHEELFVDQYDELLRAALRVTEGDRQAAEDLVQDAYIRFTLVQPPLDEVERLDAYFYVMLRNMHTSRVRRRARASEVSFSILDFDSLTIGLKALDVSSRIEARQTLYAACEYGCTRRHSSKAGSLFLLRFFHGYLPSEVARMARVSTAVVDDRLYRARREVKLFVHDPGQLAFIGSDDAMRTWSSSVLDDVDGSEDGLVRQLRAMIFDERHVNCWPKRALRELYREDRREPLTREQLAALVCCPLCLDEVNALLNIPKLASRWPTDTLGPGARGGVGNGKSSSRLASARQRVRAVFEHRPRELRVLVNGFELGAHTLGPQQSDLMLTANVGEQVALVEVFSEQGLCLLFLDACPPPDGPVRQRRRVELSEGRHAELEVAFGGPWPTITATYFDPRGASPPQTEQSVADEAFDTEEARTGASIWARWTRFFGLRPATAVIMLGLLLVWLLFWTPGLEVSAAGRIAHTIKWLVTGLMGPQKASALPAASPRLTPTPAPERPESAVRPIAAASTPRLTSARRTILELRAISQLQQADAYLGQEVSFGPITGTRVEMRATVDGKSRKETLERALATLVSARGVHAEIEDLREAVGRLRPLEVPGETPSQSVVFVRDQFPMFEPLRRYFSHQQEYERQGTEAAAPVDETQIDVQVRRYAMRLLEHSRRALRHTWALKHLADHFSSSTIHVASTETQELWQVVIREHVRGYRQEIALLRGALQPVVGMSALVESDLPEAPLATEGETLDAWSRIARLLELQKTQDATIRAAFTIRSESSGVSFVQTTAFWRLLDESDTLATEIPGPPSP
jgi:RNA polymerase sigma factor (sigma-70 family)